MGTSWQAALGCYWPWGFVTFVRALKTRFSVTKVALRFRRKALWKFGLAVIRQSGFCPCQRTKVIGRSSRRAAEGTRVHQDWIEGRLMVLQSIDLRTGYSNCWKASGPRRPLRPLRSSVHRSDFFEQKVAKDAKMKNRKIRKEGFLDRRNKPI